MTAFGPPLYRDMLHREDIKPQALDEWVDGLLDVGIPSVQYAVRRHGELVVSAATGYHDREQRHATRGSMYVLLSSTKALTVLVMLMLRDRGYFDWDDRISAYWPEFAAEGKQDVTIRHVISHRAGLSPEPAGTSWAWWRDREQTARQVASLGLRWEPGTSVGYHNRTWGMMLDELAWRMTGRRVGELLHGEILRPIGIEDLHLGYSDRKVDQRLLRIASPASPVSSDQAATTGVDQAQEFRPRIGGEDNPFNAAELLRLPLAFGTAVGSAEAASDAASFLSGCGLHRSHRIFSVDVFREARERQDAPGDVDQTLGAPADWGLGLQLDIFQKVPGLRNAVGHAGGRTVVVFGDPSSGVSGACILGGVGHDSSAALFDRKAPTRWPVTFAEAVAADLGLSSE